MTVTIKDKMLEIIGGLNKERAVWGAKGHNKCFSTCCGHVSVPLTLAQTHTKYTPTARQTAQESAFNTDNNLHSSALNAQHVTFMHTYTHISNICAPNGHNPCPFFTFKSLPTPVWGPYVNYLC